MSLSAFDDKSHPPTDAELTSTLGASHSVWAELLAAIDARVGGIEPTWKFSGKTTGWGLRLMRNGRVLVYMTPQSDQFLVSFVLGERAATAASTTTLPSALREAIDRAPRYAEGRGVRIAVRDATLVTALVRLAEIKRDH